MTVYILHRSQSNVSHARHHSVPNAVNIGFPLLEVAWTLRGICVSRRHSHRLVRTCTVIDVPLYGVRVCWLEPRGTFGNIGHKTGKLPKQRLAVFSAVLKRHRNTFEYHYNVT